MKSCRIVVGKKNAAQSNCFLLVDETQLQKLVRYDSGGSVRQDEESNLYTGIIVFMIVSLKQSIPYVVKSRPEVSINGKWFKKEIEKRMYFKFKRNWF